MGRLAQPFVKHCCIAAQSCLQRWLGNKNPFYVRLQPSTVYGITRL